MRQSMDKMSLGDRMKTFYEAPNTDVLPMRLPVIMRLDGRAFHTLTKKLDRPFDGKIIDLMQNTAKYLCENISGAVFAYTQSDEISILIHNYKKLKTEAWFNNEVQKMVSISASIASSYFTANSDTIFNKITIAQFDSRVFVIPESEVCNYFIWRQQDWERNSVQMLARSLFSQKECHKKNNSELHEMCFQKGKNWNNLPIYLKRGTGVFKEETKRDKNGELIERGKWIIDKKIPIFTKNRFYINNFLKVEEN